MLYAAYGSNLHPVRLRMRIPRAELAGTAVIDGRTLCFDKRSNVDGTGKCSIRPAAGSAVHVAVYAMPAEERRRLDEIEGLGDGYELETLVLPGFGTCYTFVAARSHVDPSLTPLDWYRELVVRGCLYHGFPADYVDAVHAVAAIADSDAERSRRQWELVRQLAMR